MSITKVLESARYAPSGDNQQPWRLVVRGNDIDVFNVPERDKSPFNEKQKGSMVAIGALIENIFIASSALGYEANIKTFPDTDNFYYFATINLEKTEPKPEPLYQYISKRCTNRNFYDSTPLSDEQKSTFLNLSGYLNGEIKIIEEPEKIDVLAKAVSKQELLVLGNPILHKTLFGNVRWTEAEADKYKTGLYIKTGELSPPQEFVMKLCSNWSILKFLSKFGLPEFISKENAKLYASGAATCVVVSRDDSPESFLAAGRLVQRLWLEATRMNLSIHPLVAIPYLYKRLLVNQEGFTDAEIKLVNDAYEAISDTFGIKNKTITFMFRIGSSKPPSARSPRLPLEEIAEIIEDKH